MHAFARQHALVEQVETVLPHVRIEGIDRKHIDLDTGIDQAPHVALEEGRDARRILAGEDGEPHERLTGWRLRLTGYVAAATEYANTSQKTLFAMRLPLMLATRTTATSAAGRMPCRRRRARQAASTLRPTAMTNGIVPSTPVAESTSSTTLCASRRGCLISCRRIPSSYLFVMGPQPSSGFSRNIWMSSGKISSRPARFPSVAADSRRFRISVEL